MASADGFYFESFGLYVQTDDVFGEPHQINAYMFDIPHDAAINGQQAARMDFMPTNTSYRDPKLRSFVMWTVLRAFNTFSQTIDYLNEKGRSDLVPEYLYGETNPEMAHFAQRLGFDVYSPRVGHKYLLVVGRTHDVLKQTGSRVKKLGDGGVQSLDHRVEELFKSDAERYKKSVAHRLGRFILGGVLPPPGLTFTKHRKRS